MVIMLSINGSLFCSTGANYLNCSTFYVKNYRNNKCNGLRLKCSQRSHIHAHRLIHSIYKPSSYTICPRDPYPLVQIEKFRGGRNPSDLCSGDPYPQATPRGPFSLGVLKRALYVPSERVHWVKI